MKTFLAVIQIDLLQMARDKLTYVFFFLMPMILTVLLGFALKDRGPADERLAIILLNRDGNSQASAALVQMIESSSVIRLVEPASEQQNLRKLERSELAALVTIPQGYAEALEKGDLLPIEVSLLPDSLNGLVAQGEVSSAAQRVSSAAASAAILAENGAGSYAGLFEEAMRAWQSPPLQTETSQAVASHKEVNRIANGYTQSAPGMLLQFAIAGLMVCSDIIVSERQTGCLKRILTTPAKASLVTLAHYSAMFIILLVQFFLLISFGQLVLKINYLENPLAIAMIVVASAACVAAIGLFLGTFSKTRDHASSYALILMFFFSALGGAWIPLELAGETFQKIAHLSPVAWGMDGFKNVLLRHLGAEANILPSVVLLAASLVLILLSSRRIKSALG